MTAENLISFFKVLPIEEQKKFMGLAEKIAQPRKTKIFIKKQPVLTDEEALRYLTTTIFKNKNS